MATVTKTNKAKWKTFAMKNQLGMESQRQDNRRRDNKSKTLNADGIKLAKRTM
jgi:hypothetical protein